MIYNHINYLIYKSIYYNYYSIIFVYKELQKVFLQVLIFRNMRFLKSGKEHKKCSACQATLTNYKHIQFEC